ncbi:hypothetical protein [Comamonas squillarum]|uniref:IS66 family insertion sequence element accessory protein TnpB n=1 Tax=Comamonas squillarum TaxID=2977320 RepID=A0ABY6A2X6_9BURK|nr:hypothetical protein [Comamonas sp. PR12]UXC20001.1 hypothetical protein N4T19_07810 [Comamonas sp. PR12]
MASAAQQAQAPLAIPATGGVCDLSKRSYFHASVLASLAFTFINRPVDCMLFELEVSLTAGTLSWPANVRWVGGLAPQNLQTGKIHIFQFRRPQSTGADQWLGSYLPNY